MDRLACVDLPAFPLQLLLQRHPDWRDLPVAVVAEDKPQARIQWVNEKARSAGVLPGMRYAGGLSLAKDLRAAPVPAQAIAKGVATLVETLRDFSPHIEPAAARFDVAIGPGVLWLDASGLLQLYPSLQRWADALLSALEARGFVTSIAVGFTRFGTYATAKATPGACVCFASKTAEMQYVQRVPLSRLEIDPGVRDTFDKLGVRTVRDFLALAPGDLQARFAPSIAAWQRLANNAQWAPLEPLPPDEPVRRVVLLDHPEVNSVRLLFVVRRELLDMLAELTRRHQAATALEIRARIDRRQRYIEHVRPAAPTLDAAQLVDLVRLRFEGSPIPGEVTELVLELQGMALREEQLKLFASRPKRDLAAGDRALARLRAELGEDAVCHAALTEGHLPEASYTWKRLTACKRPEPTPDRAQLIRRIRTHPLALSHSPDQRPVSALRLQEPEPPVRWHGPYVLSGGWWNRLIRREYYFVESHTGRLLWCYRDLERLRWFLQGEIE